MNNPEYLGEKPIGSLLWKFSIPAITGMVVNALYNVVDSIFVGNGVGEKGLAAVTIAFPIMLILMGFGMLVGVGAAAQVSIRIGQQQKEEAERFLGNALSLLLICYVVISSVVMLFLDPILTGLGAEPSILPLARQFSGIILLGSIFTYIAFGLNSMIRAQGKPKTAMATMLISAGLNTVLNPLFIFGFKMGISGSALATVLSQAVSSCWVLWFFWGGGSFLKFKRQNLLPDIEIVKQIVAIGISPFAMQVAASIVSVLFNQSLVQYGGEVAVAAMGIITRVSMLILMPIFGISQGTQPIIGYNFGAKQDDRVEETLKKAIMAATGVAVAGFLAVQFLDQPIIRLFNGNANLIRIGAKGLRIYLSMLPIIGFQVICTTYFQAVGKPKQSLILSLSRQLLILIPLVLVLPGIFGLTGIWLAGPVADAVSSVLTGVLLFRELRQQRRGRIVV
jgi:putative MATE family efflux protein